MPEVALSTRCCLEKMGCLVIDGTGKSNNRHCLNRTKNKHEYISYNFYVLLNEHHDTILITNLMHKFVIFNNMCILQSSTCFEQYYAHPQEVNCVNMNI
jgi:hypothetical protein